MDMLQLARLRNARTSRSSSYDVSGRNSDWWNIPAGESRVLADIKGPGIITHLWLTQGRNYRECLIRITWDGASQPSVVCPLGDFFGLGHGIVNSYQSQLFTASTSGNNQFNTGCALNCYAPMPFRKRAVIELVNESQFEHKQYFYVDYEKVGAADLRGLGYFHAEFRRTNPFLGWGPEITVNVPECDVPNLKRQAWENNYVILETRGQGHYLGCNLSVTNIQGTWWGEGDDMIWVDGYKWPPDLHGTGSEDYLNQAWGMQPNAFLRNGSSIHEANTGGYQTSYVHHLENPVHFRKEIKVTIEHGHANHLGNEMSSVAYWYAAKPTRVVAVPPVARRMPVKKVDGQWVIEESNRCPGRPVTITDDMRQMKAQWQRQQAVVRSKRLSPRHSAFVTRWQVSQLQPAADITRVKAVKLADRLGWRTVTDKQPREPFLICVHDLYGDKDGIVYLANRFRVKTPAPAPAPGRWTLHVGHDGPVRVFVDGQAVATEPKRVNPAPQTRTRAAVSLSKGVHEIVIALDTDGGAGWGIYFSFEAAKGAREEFPELIVG